MDSVRRCQELPNISDRASFKMNFLLGKADDDGTSGITYLIKEKSHTNNSSYSQRKED